MDVVNCKNIATFCAKLPTFFSFFTRSNTATKRSHLLERILTPQPFLSVSLSETPVCASLATTFYKRESKTSDDDDGFVDAATKNAEMDNAAGTSVVEIDVVI